MKTPKASTSKTRKAQRFLRCDLLRPGDIILSASPEKEGRWIAHGSHQIGTRHAFSHAAIVLNRNFIFEAHDDGLLSRPLAICKALFESGKNTRIMLHDISNFQRARVLRHKALEKEDYYQLEEDLLEILHTYWAMEYPERAKLAKSAATTSIGRSFVKLALGLKDKWEEYFGAEKKPELPGPFCSMIAVIALERLAPHHPLFRPRVKPEEVSPNKLATSSQLVTVPNAIVEDISELDQFTNDPEHVNKFNEIILVGSDNGKGLTDTLKTERAQSKQLVQIRRTLASMEKRVKNMMRRK